MGQTRAAELDQLRFAKFASGLHDHQSFGNLAPFFIRNRDDGSLVDVGMCRESFLHLERGNVFASTDDDVFPAINNKDVTILVNGSHVSGVKPSPAQGFGTGLGLLPVARHNTIAASDDFTHGLGIARHILVVEIHDTKLNPGDGASGHGLRHKALFPLPLQSWLDLRSG